jgi:hypothetical protein
MKTINIKGFQADELEFWIPKEFTSKMADSLRNTDIRVSIQLAPIDDNRAMRDVDAFFVALVGEKPRREKIKEFIVQFGQRNGLEIGEWPKDF